MWPFSETNAAAMRTLKTRLQKAGSPVARMSRRFTLAGFCIPAMRIVAPDVALDRGDVTDII
jgi:hypothetical protein